MRTRCLAVLLLASALWLSAGLHTQANAFGTTPALVVVDGVLLLLVAAFVSVGWLFRLHKRRQHEIVLNAAWREVLDDPHYTERRQFEERKRTGEVRENEKEARHDHTASS